MGESMFHAYNFVKSAELSNASVPADFGLVSDYIKSLDNMQLLHGNSVVAITELPSLKICYASKGVTEIFGIDQSDLKLSAIVDRVAPEDIEFIKACEEKVFFFLFGSGKDRSDEYKAIFTVRAKDLTGEYHQYIKQSFCVRHKMTNKVNYGIHILTKSDHLRLANRYTFSLVNMKGGQSFYNIDPFKDFESFLIKEPSVYTTTEIKIIFFISKGLKTNEIAEKLNISEGTVRTHRKNILGKSGSINMITVVVDCLKSGMI